MTRSQLLQACHEFAAKYGWTLDQVMNTTILRDRAIERFCNRTACPE